MDPNERGASPTFARPSSQRLRDCILDAARSRELVLRPGAEGDLPEILAVACASFRTPSGWTDCQDNVRRYEPGFADSCREHGRVRIDVVANARGRISAYAYTQLRDNGEVYVIELAAWPPDRADKLLGAGELVLAFALCRAHLQDGCQSTTLNLVHGSEPDPEGPEYRSLEDLLRYYGRVGFEVVTGARGCLADGSPRDPEDVWMRGDLCDVLAKLVERIERAQASGS